LLSERPINRCDGARKGVIPGRSGLPSLPSPDYKPNSPFRGIAAHLLPERSRAGIHKLSTVLSTLSVFYSASRYILIILFFLTAGRPSLSAPRSSLAVSSQALLFQVAQESISFHQRSLSSPLSLSPSLSLSLPPSVHPPLVKPHLPRKRLAESRRGGGGGGERREVRLR